MKRTFIGTSTLLLLVGLISADGDGPISPYQIRKAEYSRDAELIEAFVDGSIRLAGEEDPLRRAQTCNVLADKLAREITHATETKATGRVVALGDLLQAVLVRGVADNLELAKNEAPKGEPWGKEFSRVADLAGDVTVGLEKSLKKTFDSLKGAPEKEALLPALEGLTRARQEVESAYTGKGRPRDKGKGKGKKKW